MEFKKGTKIGLRDKHGREMKIGDTVKLKIYNDGAYRDVFGKVDFSYYSFGLWIDSAWWPFSDLRGDEFEIIEAEEME